MPSVTLPAVTPPRTPGHAEDTVDPTHPKTHQLILTRDSLGAVALSKIKAVSHAFENLPSIADIVLASDKHQRDTLRRQISEFGSTLADLKAQPSELPSNHTLRHKYDPSIEQMQGALAELDLTMDLFCNSHGQIPIRLSHPSPKQEIAVFSRLRELHRRFLTLAGLPAKPVNDHMRISVPELKKALVSKLSEGASPTEIALLRDTLSQIEKLRGYLFQANIAFAIDRLNAYLPRYIDGRYRDDLEQAAFLGMVKAIDDLDLNRGTKFVSYAGYHIMHELYDALKILASPNRAPQLFFSKSPRNPQYAIIKVR